MPRRQLSLAVLAAGALFLSACSGAGGADADADTSPADSEELRTVTLGLMPIAPSVAVEYGIQEGIFEDHGFEVEVSQGASGTATLPAVFAGQLDFDIGNPMSVAIARDQGMDMRIVAGFSNSYAEGDDIAGLVVRADSGIEGYADLESRTTAVVSLQGHNTLTTQDVAEQAGADPENLEFTELQFSDMVNQLEQGSADAIFLPEPFLSRALSDAENRLLGYNFQDSVPGLPTLVTYTSGALVDDNPELVADFRAAMEDVLDRAAANKEDVKDVLPAFLGMPEEAAAQMRMEEWSGEIRRGEIDRLNELALRHGYISDEIDPNAFYVD